MRIGIFGSGMIGSTLAALWHQAGHEIRFGARDPQKTQQVAARIAPQLGAGRPAEVADWAEVLLLAVPFHATGALATEIAEHAKGKPVLDAGNAIPQRDGEAGTEAARMGTGVYTARYLPGALVIKAYNTVYFKTIAAQHQQSGPRVAVPLVGDDAGALAIAAQLVRDSGLDPVLVGPLSESKRIDFGASVWNSNMTAAQLCSALDLPASRGH